MSITLIIIISILFLHFILVQSVLIIDSISGIRSYLRDKKNSNKSINNK